MAKDKKDAPHAASKTGPDLSSVSRDKDRLVLEQLVALGDDLSRRRHTILFFYREAGDARTENELFDAIVREGEAQGMRVADRDEDRLIVEGEKYVDPENLDWLVRWALDLAVRAGVSFDGWECAVDAPGPN